jgi:hypothetical protein
MKKLLWCGGSHLANAKLIIEELCLEFNNTFYVTGGEKNRDWAKQGGRYKAKGTIIGGNAYEPTVFYDLEEYSRIIFVGQYIQPQRFLQSDQPLSTSILNIMFPSDSFLINIPGGIYNEPLAIFPKLAPKKCLLLCDPMPSSDSPFSEVPRKSKEYFLQRVVDFCRLREMTIAFQPPNTLDGNVTTKAHFKRKSDDDIHMNDQFWKEYLQGILSQITPK